MKILDHKEQLENVAAIGEEIEQIVEDKEVEFIDACLIYCQENKVEIEVLGSLLKKHQKVVSKIRKEAEKLNFLEKPNTVKLVLPYKQLGDS